GADIRFIQQMLGHVKLETTQIYTQVSIRKLKEIHTATHTSARLDGRRARATAEDDSTSRTEPDVAPSAEELLTSLAAEAAEEERDAEEVG
ncbi:MAG: hypothetical protein L0027_10220, partial [Candidatus Rokubacteria bacterium]|nr:hypothetical protein [Candidatus Rokubacteria bacterium]